MTSWPEAFGPAEIDKLHAATLEVLEKVGVEFQLEEALEIFKDRGAGVEGSRVYLPRALSTAPERFRLEARNPGRSLWIGGEETVFAPPAGCVYIQKDGSQRRQAVPRDYLDLVRVIQQSGHYRTNGGGIVIPQDSFASDEEKFAWLVLAGHWYSDKPQMGLNLGGEVSRNVMDLSEIVFAGQAGCHVLGTVNSDSPLMYAPQMLESLLIYARAGQGLIIAPCSMAMATSPATLAGTHGEGKILGREVKTVIDTGAYTSNWAITGVAMGKKLFRLYRIEHQRYQTASVYTNTPVAGAARGYGSPQIHAITEINLDCSVAAAKCAFRVMT